jgi:hypothetical protein
MPYLYRMLAGILILTLTGSYAQSQCLNDAAESESAAIEASKAEWIPVLIQDCLETFTHLLNQGKIKEAMAILNEAKKLDSQCDSTPNVMYMRLTGQSGWAWSTRSDSRIHNGVTSSAARAPATTNFAANAVPCCAQGCAIAREDASSSPSSGQSFARNEKNCTAATVKGQRCGSCSVLSAFTVVSTEKTSCKCGTNCQCGTKTCGCGTSCKCADKAGACCAHCECRASAIAHPEYVAAQPILHALPIPGLVPSMMHPMHPLMVHPAVIEAAPHYEQMITAAPMPVAHQAVVAEVLPPPTPVGITLVSSVEQTQAMQDIRVTAKGKRVHVVTPRFEAFCDRLTYCDGNTRLRLEGKVRVTVRPANSAGPSRVRAERVVVGLNDGTFTISGLTESNSDLK